MAENGGAWCAAPFVGHSIMRVGIDEQLTGPAIRY
jgi:hypothetical protein